jgi:adenylate kinase family enzyme
MYCLELNETLKSHIYYYLGKEFNNQPEEYKNKIKTFISSIYENKNDEYIDEIETDTIRKKLKDFKFPLGKFEWYYENSILEIEIQDEGTAKMSNSYNNIHLYYYKKVTIKNSSIDILDKFVDYVKNYENILKPNNNSIRIFYNIKNNWELYNTIIPQSIENIYLDEIIKDKFINHIDKFIDSKEKYIKFGRLHKMNILLYGVPGSGKTCLCKAIAKKYNRDVYILNFTKSLTDEILIQLISNIHKNAIILLEDIDSYFDKRNALDINVSFSCLINILDGTMSKGNGNLLFITANNPQNMDKALLRPGRIDKIIKFDYPDKHIIKCAFDDLVDDLYKDLFETFYEKIKKLQLNMSSIIDYLFRNSDTFILNIDELSEQSKLRNDICMPNVNIYN